jgi:hypothetical protein
MIQKLLDFMGSSTGPGRAALDLINALSSGSEPSLALVEAGILDRLRPMAQAAEIGNAIALSGLIANLVSHDEVCAVLSDKTFVGEIWSLWDNDLSESDKVRLLTCMQNVSTPMQLVPDVLSVGFIVASKSIILHEPLEVKYAACGVLGNLTRDTSAQSVIIGLDMLPGLVAIMNQYNEVEDPISAKVSVFCTLRNLAVDPVAARYFAQAHTLDLILLELEQCVNDASSQEVFLRFILSFAYNLSTDDISVVQLRTHDLARIIAPLLDHHEQFIRIATILTLVNTDPDHPSLRIDADLVRELTNILGCSLTGQMYAELIWLLFAPLQGLANLAKSPAICKIILQSPVVLKHLGMFFSTTRDERATRHALELCASLASLADIAISFPDLEANISKLSQDTTAPQRLRSLAKAVLKNLAILRGTYVEEVAPLPVVQTVAFALNSFLFGGR